MTVVVLHRGRWYNVRPLPSICLIETDTGRHVRSDTKLHKRIQQKALAELAAQAAKIAAEGRTPA
jgi:hypothetical protein